MKKKHDLDTNESDKIKGGYRKKFILYPTFWTEKANEVGHKLNWKRYRFTRANHDKIVKEKGIYCFVLQPEVKNFFETKYLLYIGKTNRTLHTRYSEYLNELEGKKKSRPKVKDMLDRYNGYLYYYFCSLDTKAKVDDVEDKLIDTFIPHVNVEIKRAKIKPEFKYIYE